MLTNQKVAPELPPRGGRYEPGTLGDVALVMSQAGINIDSVYVTTRGHVVLGVDRSGRNHPGRRGLGRDDSRMSRTLRCDQPSKRPVPADVNLKTTQAFSVTMPPSPLSLGDRVVDRRAALVGSVCLLAAPPNLHT
jgi:hypothetical protein